MELTIPQTAKVFRLVRGTSKSRWHLLQKTVDNGFTEKSHPSRPEWWGTLTYKAYCSARIDGRPEEGMCVELSTVEQITSICPACYPYQKLDGKVTS